jgi:outer membrane protein assembly factor BamB
MKTRSVVSSTLPVELMWTLSLDGKVTQSPLVTEHWAAIVTQNSLYLVDIISGDVQWQLPNHTYPYELPMVAMEDSLVIGASGGMITSREIETGHLKWQSQVNDFEDSHITINSIITADGLVVVASQPTEIHALSPNDGSLQWKISSRTNSMRPRGVRVYSHDAQVYISDIETYIIDAPTGRINNVIDVDVTRLQFAGDYLFDPFGVYDAETLAYLFDLKAPTRKQPINSCDGLQLPYAIEQDIVIAADSCGGTYALSLANGQVIWEYMPKLAASPPIAVMHDVVYALMHNGEIHAIAADTGESIGILKTDAPLASFAQGELTSLGIVTNGEVLIATFNEPTVFGLSSTSN